MPSADSVHYHSSENAEIRRELETLKVAVQSLKGMVRDGELRVEKETHEAEQARRALSSLKVGTPGTPSNVFIYTLQCIWCPFHLAKHILLSFFACTIAQDELAASTKALKITSEARDVINEKHNVLVVQHEADLDKIRRLQAELNTVKAQLESFKEEQVTSFALCSSTLESMGGTVSFFLVARVRIASQY